MIQPAAKFAFERTVQDYARWLAVKEEERSPAAAWWWSTALALYREQDAMPAAWAHAMALPSGASYADAAHVLMDALAGQTVLPWPEEFPRRYGVPQTSEAAGD
jgi:hypothetical protein